MLKGQERLRSSTKGLVLILLFGILLSCSAYQGYRRAQIAEEHGDWDEAVLQYLELVDRYPNKVSYRTFTHALDTVQPITAFSQRT